MTVLFLSRSKHQGNPSPIVQAQINSFKGKLDLIAYVLQGSGILSYISNILKVRRFIKSNQPNIVHAHYSYVGMIASLATKKPLIVSLMGSDIYDHRLGRCLIRFFSAFFWSAVIVKSKRLKKKIKLKNAHVIPNGVNLDLFKPIDFALAQNKLGFMKDKKYILFLADPLRKEKNYTLAKAACDIISKDHNIELKVVFDVPHEEIPIYLSGADVLLLTSFFEGSPNVIKEGMACNCPIVSTDVGDVREVIGDTAGCYISSRDPADLAKKISLTIRDNKRTNGRENILPLDDKIIAAKLTELYQSI